MADIPCYIAFNFEINQRSVAELIAAVTESMGQSSEVHILLSSSGGSSRDAIHLYHWLKALSRRIVMYNTGSVESTANVVFQAADHRVAAPDSSFMFHSLQWTFSNETLQEPVIRERLLTLDSDRQKISSIILRHTKLKEHAVGNLFREPTFFNAEQARQCGMVDEVAEIEFPERVAIRYMT